MKDYLVEALIPDDVSDTPYIIANVSGTSPLEVTISGQSGLSASRLASYSPSTNDLVLCLQTGSDVVILGQIISGG